MVGVLSAMHKDQELADLMRSQVIDARKDMLDEILERAVAAGELTSRHGCRRGRRSAVGNVLQPSGDQRRADR